MKLLSCLAVLVSAMPALAQNPVPGPGREASQLFDGAGIIVVRAPDSARVALLKMRTVLAAQGYELDTARAAYVTTKPRAFVAAGGILYVYQVAVGPAATGSQLVLTGHLIDDRNPKYHFEIPMRWVKPGDILADQQCFGYADKVAKAYPDGKVIYRQKIIRK